MPDRTLTDAAAPAALVAFLRGVERRGAILAQLQCGTPQLGDVALAAAMRAFRECAPQLPMEEWPTRFWGLLLAAPALRHATADAAWPARLVPLRGLGNGLRAALLLRLAAGLDETQAAAVLGIEPATYRAALGRAAGRGIEGVPDPDAWRALAEAIRDELQALTPARLAHLARLREQALQPRTRLRQAPASRAGVGARRGLWAGVVACVLGLAASFLLPLGLPHDAADARIEREALPESSPASSFDATTGRLADPDFEMLLASGDQAPPADVAFDAWYAARRADPPPVIGAATVAEAGAAHDMTGTDAPH